VQTELKAVVRSTLPEALAAAVTVEWTVQDGEVQKPVTGEARTGEANTEPGVLTTRVNEADGVSGRCRRRRRAERLWGGWCEARC